MKSPFFSRKDAQGIIARMRPAVFLDRDGVIVQDRIVIITHQSVVDRGIIKQSTAEQINQQLKLEIQNAGVPDGWNLSVPTPSR